MPLDYQKLGNHALNTFDELAKAYADDEDPRIEEVVIIVGLSARDETGEAEPNKETGERRRRTTFFHATTADPFVQIGLTRAGLYSVEEEWR